MNVLVNINLNGSEIQNVLLQNLASDPTALGAGQTYYNTTLSAIRYYNGSTWVTLALSTGGGTVDSIIAGTGISVNAVGSDYTVSHADTSSVSNLDTSNAQVIDTITFDTFGHVTAITTRNLTLANLGYTGASDADKYASWEAQADGGSPIAITTLASLDFVGGDGITSAVTSGPNAVTFNLDATVVRTTGAQTIAGNKTFSDDVAVNGNLTVSGSVISTLSETVKIEDSLMLLNSNETGTPTADAGFIVERGTSQNVGLFWDESADVWAFVNTNEDGTTNGNVTIASYATIKANRIQAALTTGSAGNNVVLTGGELVTRTTAETKADYAIRSHKETIGNGTNTNYTVTHNFGTRDVMVQMYTIADHETVYANVVRNTTNTVDIDFRAAPASASIRVLIKEI